MLRLTRRAVLASAALAPFAPPARADLLEAAQHEGSVTWYVAQMSGEAAEAMGRHFTERHPGVSVSVIRTTGQVAYERLQQELKNGAPHCDVFSSTDIAHYPALKARGALAHYDAQNAAELAGPYQGIGEPGYYYPTTGSLQILVYNTRNVQPADVPRACTDLLAPRFKGRVAVGHPAFSGFFGQWVLAMRKLHGWEFFEKLADNKPRIGRSGNDPITMLNAGESLVGTGPVSTASQTAQKGNPIGYVYPEDGTLLCVGPSAILAQAPHPNAARLFLEWLLSKDYADASAAWFLEPVRADAAPIPGTKPISQVKTMALTTQEIAKGIPEVIEQWRDTFGV
jgi:iron(III) transport system substrate-binding protein